MDSIKLLGLNSISGSMPTFYSPGTSARATYLQRILGGEVTYFAERFHASLRPITMAVLDARQWPKVAGDEPYGMPSIGGTIPAVFVMPATWNDVTWTVFPKREEVPPATAG